MADETATRNDVGTARVELTLPSESRYIRLARLLASGMATSCGLVLDEVEDFRVAVDELCATLIELADGDPVRLAFEHTDDALVVVGTTTTSSGTAIDDDRLSLSRQILDVVTDGHGLEHTDDTVIFTARKRLRGRGAG